MRKSIFFAFLYIFFQQGFRGNTKKYKNVDMNKGLYVIIFFIEFFFVNFEEEDSAFSF